MPKLLKGTEEAKEFMRKMREKKNTKPKSEETNIKKVRKPRIKKDLNVLITDNTKKLKPVESKVFETFPFPQTEKPEKVILKNVVKF